MICRNKINGVEIYAFGFTPAADQWGKFLAYARKNVPPEFKNKIRDIHVSADYTEHGTLFAISYSVQKIVGKLVPDTEINAIEPENES